MVEACVRSIACQCYSCLSDYSTRNEVKNCIDMTTEELRQTTSRIVVNLKSSPKQYEGCIQSIDCLCNSCLDVCLRKKDEHCIHSVDCQCDSCLQDRETQVEVIETTEESVKQEDQLSENALEDLESDDALKMFDELLQLELVHMSCLVYGSSPYIYAVQNDGANIVFDPGGRVFVWLNQLNKCAEIEVSWQIPLGVDLKSLFCKRGNVGQLPKHQQSYYMCLADSISEFPLSVYSLDYATTYTPVDAKIVKEWTLKHPTMKQFIGVLVVQWRKRKSSVSELLHAFFTCFWLGWDITICVCWISCPNSTAHRSLVITLGEVVKFKGSLVVTGALFPFFVYSLYYNKIQLPRNAQAKNKWFARKFDKTLDDYWENIICVVGEVHDSYLAGCWLGWGSINGVVTSMLLFITTLETWAVNYGLMFHDQGCSKALNKATFSIKHMGKKTLVGWHIKRYKSISRNCDDTMEKYADVFNSKGKLFRGVDSPVDTGWILVEEEVFSLECYEDEVVKSLMRTVIVSLASHGSLINMCTRDCSWENAYTRTFRSCDTNKLLVLQLTPCFHYISSFILLVFDPGGFIASFNIESLQVGNERKLLCVERLLLKALPCAISSRNYVAEIYKEMTSLNGFVEVVFADMCSSHNQDKKFIFGFIISRVIGLLGLGIFVSFPLYFLLYIYSLVTLSSLSGCYGFASKSTLDEGTVVSNNSLSCEKFYYIFGTIKMLGLLEETEGANQQEILKSSRGMFPESARFQEAFQVVQVNVTTRMLPVSVVDMVDVGDSAASFFLAGVVFACGTVNTEHFGTCSLQGYFNFTDIMKKLRAKVTWIWKILTEKGPSKRSFERKHLLANDFLTASRNPHHQSLKPLTQCVLKALGYGNNKRVSLEDTSILIEGNVVNKGCGLKMNKTQIDMNNSVSLDHTEVLQSAEEKLIQVGEVKCCVPSVEHHILLQYCRWHWMLSGCSTVPATSTAH